FQSRKFGADGPSRLMPSFRSVSQIIARRSAPGYGNGRSTTELTTLKIAVFAPMPSARTSKATMVKPGALRNVRKEYRKSFRKVSICLFVKQVKGRSRDWASDWNY